MNSDNITKELSYEMLYKMMLIRAFEETVSEYKMKRMIYGMAHCYTGQEAIAVGVCSALKHEDYIISNHRPHGHAIAKGVSPKKMMAEIFGKSTGTNSGKGGSMHIYDASKGLITSTGIVGSGIPVACGAAFASKYLNDGKVTCVFFGDGAGNEGVLHEILNIASVWKLPLIFILEDNALAVTTLTSQTSACRDYVQLANVYGIQGVHADGQNVEEVFKAAQFAITRARKGQGPTLIQAKTIRFSEHAEGEWYLRMKKTGYRDYDKLEEECKSKCPINQYIKYTLDNGILSENEIDDMRKKIDEIMQESVEYATNSPAPLPETAFENIYK